VHNEKIMTNETMTWAGVTDNLLMGRYPVAVILLSIIVTIAVVFLIVWLFRKPLMKYFLHERLGVATKTEIAEVKSDVANIKKELRENDFFHTNKALLILASAILKDDEQRFERIKDTIMETTPDNRKDEIKSITI
jgi:flagellar basal body-associated protein FliL